jgi:hypothetical protein
MNEEAYVRYDEQPQRPDPQTIELDCQPGSLRPDELIEDVIKGTGLEVRDTVSRFFGCFTWDYSDVDPETWKEIRPTLGKRITRLYEHGVIRYGSW